MNRYLITSRYLHRASVNIFLLISVCMLLVACSSSRHVSKELQHKERQLKQEYAYDDDLTPFRRSLLDEAIEWLGTPYKYATAEKGQSTDCSGFVMQVFLSKLDVKLPRNSAKQAEYCLPIKPEEVMGGDLVFFVTVSDPDKISHVGIMLDKTSFIHASSSKGVVVSRMDNPWYVRRFKTYGRVPALSES